MGSYYENAHAGQSSGPRVLGLDRCGLRRGTQLGVAKEAPGFADLLDTIRWKRESHLSFMWIFSGCGMTTWVGVSGNITAWPVFIGRPLTGGDLPLK